MKTVHPNFKYKVAMECYDILLFESYHRYNIRPILSEKIALFLGFISGGMVDRQCTLAATQRCYQEHFNHGHNTITTIVHSESHIHDNCEDICKGHIKLI